MLDSVEMSMKRVLLMHVRYDLNRNSWNEIFQTWPLFQTEEKEGSKSERSRGTGLKW